MRRAGRHQFSLHGGGTGRKIGKAYCIGEEAALSVTNFRSGTLNDNNFVVNPDDAAQQSEGTLALGQIKVNARVMVRFILE